MLGSSLAKARTNLGLALPVLNAAAVILLIFLKPFANFKVFAISPIPGITAATALIRADPY